MKKNQSLFRKLSILALFGPLVFLFVTACFEIIGVDQPASVKAGETMTVTVNAAFDPEGSGVTFKTIIFGMLVPKSWDAPNNTSVRFDSDHNSNPNRPASGVMVYDTGDLSFWKSQSKGVDGQITGNTWSEDMEAILGTGENYGEMEWVVFYSNKFIDVSEPIEGTITIQIKVGDQHSGTQLGYFVGSTDEGLKYEEGGTAPNAASRHYDVEFPDCLIITDAAENATDLCGSPPTFTASIVPESYLFDDIISIRFDAKEGFEGSNTALYNANEVFACAKAVLSDGSVIEKCERNSASKMSLIGNNIWELTLWPTGYFGIPEGQLMTELQLNFQNADGSIIVKNPGFDEDMIFGQICN